MLQRKHRGSNSSSSTLCRVKKPSSLSRLKSSLSLLESPSSSFPLANALGASNPSSHEESCCVALSTDFSRDGFMLLLLLLLMISSLMKKRAFLISDCFCLRR
jgi:hypothetical protein